jgi:uncharacterized protein
MTTSIASEKYVSFTSFRKDGTPVSLPVWIVDLGDGTVGFTTSADSFKVKRVRRNPSVTLQPCTARGKVAPGAVSVNGTATIVDGAAHDRVWALVRKKYGFQATLIDLADRAKRAVSSVRKRGAAASGSKGSDPDVAVVITLANA